MTTTRPLTSFSRLILRQTQPARCLNGTSTRFYATNHNNSNDKSGSDSSTDRNPSAQRDAQDDRHQMNPEANEYAKSGTDAEAAKQDEAAFDPNITDPQEAKKKAGEGNDVNPLDASPANVELSQKEGTREDVAGSK